MKPAPGPGGLTLGNYWSGHHQEDGMSLFKRSFVMAVQAV